MIVSYKNLQLNCIIVIVVVSIFISLACIAMCLWTVIGSFPGHAYLWFHPNDYESLISHLFCQHDFKSHFLSVARCLCVPFILILTKAHFIF